MSRRKNIWIMLFVLLLGLFALRLALGSVYIPFDHLLHPGSIEKSILFNIRLPHALTAMLAGFILSICGLLMQSIFRNPLAGPFVLGVSSGASLMVALVLMFGLSSTLSQLGVSFAAMLGSMGVVLIIGMISMRYSDNFTLLIFGLMLGYVFSAFQGLLEYFGDARSLKNFVVWGMGSFGNVKAWQIAVLGIDALLICGFSLRYSKQLDFYALGEDYARLEGVKVKQLKLILLLLVGVSAGLVTAFCGPIAFLGIAVPHVAALLIQSKKHKNWILFTGITGVLLALMCDILAEMPGLSLTIPVNVITCIIGAPIVIWVLLKSKRKHL